MLISRNIASEGNTYKFILFLSIYFRRNSIIMAGTSSKPRTRHSSGTKMSEFIGPGKEFNPSELPTNRAVIQRGILQKETKAIFFNLDMSKYTNREVAQDLTPLLIAQWTKSNAKFKSPIIIQEKSVVKKIVKLWETVEKVVWGRANKKIKEQLELDLDKLMDLTSCSHTIYLCENKEQSSCNSPEECSGHINCSCPLIYKIPTMELRWIYSQRSKVGEKSDMQMGGNDHKETKKQVRAEKRKADELETHQKKIRKEEEEKESLIDYMEDSEDMGSLDEATAEELRAVTFQPHTKKLTAEQARKSRVLVDWLLEDKLGDCANLVTRFLWKPPTRRNLMSVLNTAKASIRWDSLHRELLCELKSIHYHHMLGLHHVTP